MSSNYALSVFTATLDKSTLLPTACKCGEYCSSDLHTTQTMSERGEKASQHHYSLRISVAVHRRHLCLRDHQLVRLRLSRQCQVLFVQLLPVLRRGRIVRNDARDVVVLSGSGCEVVEGDYTSDSKDRLAPNMR